MNLTTVSPSDIQENWSPKTLQAALYCLRNDYSDQEIDAYCRERWQERPQPCILDPEQVCSIKKMLQQLGEDLGVATDDPSFLNLVLRELGSMDSFDAFWLKHKIQTVVHDVMERFYMDELERGISDALPDLTPGQKACFRVFQIEKLWDFLLECYERYPGRWNLQSHQNFGPDSQKQLWEKMFRIYGLTLPLSDAEKDEIRHARAENNK